MKNRMLLKAGASILTAAVILTAVPLMPPAFGGITAQAEGETAAETAESSGPVNDSISDETAGDTGTSAPGSGGTGETNDGRTETADSGSGGTDAGSTEAPIPESGGADAGSTGTPAPETGETDTGNTETHNQENSGTGEAGSSTGTPGVGSTDSSDPGSSTPGTPGTGSTDISDPDSSTEMPNVGSTDTSDPDSSTETPGTGSTDTSDPGSSTPGTPGTASTDTSDQDSSTAGKEHTDSAETTPSENGDTAADPSGSTDSSAAASEKAEQPLEKEPIPANVLPLQNKNVSEFEFDGKGGITGYSGSDADLVVPSEINGVKVTTICENAFEQTYDVKSISFPKTLKNIDAFAFYCCLALSDVSFNGSAPEIDSTAFTQSGEDSDNGYVTFHCPANLQSDYEAALDDWLSDNQLEADLPDYEATDTPPEIPTATPGDYLLRKCQNNEVYITGITPGCKETSIEIPASLDDHPVVGIAENAFEGAGKITSVTIAAPITSIGPKAFYNCSALTDISFSEPDQLQRIGENAFYQCRKLNGIDLSGTALQTIAPNTFESCFALTSAALPASLKSIDEFGFYKCTGLQQIQLPDGLAKIDTGAFQYADLQEITIPASVTEIGDHAFWCSRLAGIEVDEGNTSFAAQDGILYNQDRTALLYYPNGIAQDTFKIPDGVQEIADMAFMVPHGVRDPLWSQESSLQFILLPDSLKTVGSNAFAQTNLERITITANVSWGDHAFDSCTKLKEVIVEEGVTEIPDCLFQNLEGLQTISLPSTLKKIGKNSFDRLPLSEINLPEGLEEIGEDAFEGSQLSSLTIPKSVRTMGDRAFYLNRNLTNVTFEEGSALEDSGKFTFNACRQLKTIALPEGMTVLNNGCFSSCNQLEKISVPSTVTTMGDFVFANSGIKSIELPDGINKMGTGDFRNSMLEYAKLPASLEKLGTCTFEGCLHLKKADMPENMKLSYLPTDTFFQCEALSELTLPARITTTEPCSLSYCRSLNVVSYRNPALKRSIFDCFAVNLNDYFGIGQWDEVSYDGLYVPASTEISKDNGFTVNTVVQTAAADETEALYDKQVKDTADSSAKTRKAAGILAKCGCAAGGTNWYTATVSPNFKYLLTSSGDTEAPKENAARDHSGDSSTGISTAWGGIINISSNTNTTRSNGSTPAAGSWIKTAKGWSFRYQTDAKPALGWEYVVWNNVPGWYHFAADGTMHTGWVEENGKKYYLSQPEDGTAGQMTTGWKKLGGKWYYFNNISNGTRGALLVNTTTPDGYKVGADGAWR